jgi:aerobic carbon-monoxide dehydrogenase small subunit
MTVVSLIVNGKEVRAEAEPRTHLADFIRDTQTLTGTHLGCEHGVCGACTVLVDDVPVRSCITYAVTCEGASVTTVEGLDDDEIGKELRSAFAREHALQCGFCTPGMLMAARDIVMRVPSASEDDIRVAMSGNLCRCTGYVGIIRAIQSVVADRRSRGIPAIPGAGRQALGPAGAGHAGSLARAPTRATASPAKTTASALRDGLDWTPQATILLAFTVNRHIDEVWTLFSDTGAVVSCLPGVSIEGDGKGPNISGKMRVKVGPIIADFYGVAQIARDPNNYKGSIQGSGHDQRSNSSARGVVDYRLLREGEKATRVDLNVGYRLTGALAQFSRTDLVQDIAGRIVAVFAQNVEARMSGKATESQAEFNAGGLFISVLRDRIGAWLRRLFG